MTDTTELKNQTPFQKSSKVNHVSCIIALITLITAGEVSAHALDLYSFGIKNSNDSKWKIIARAL